MHGTDVNDGPCHLSEDTEWADQGQWKVTELMDCRHNEWKDIWSFVRRESKMVYERWCSKVPLQLRLWRDSAIAKDRV